MNNFKINLKNVRETFSKLSNALNEDTSKKHDLKVSALVSDLAEATPVDTGLAKASWGVSKKVEGTIIISLIENSVDYIERLNKGSSKQAPMYFIERTALKYGRPLGTILDVT